MTRGIRLAAALGVAAVAAACTSAPPPPGIPTPTPPPSVTAGRPALLQPDGKVRYHLVIRADAGVAFLPVRVTALVGTGTLGWTRWTEAAFAYDERSDRFVLAQAAESGAKQEEWVNVVFPGSNQELEIAVDYEGEKPPDEERFRVIYATLGLGELATHAYVKPAKGPAGKEGEAVPREPLGERLRAVDVSRWLASGFLLRTGLSNRDEVIVTVPGPKAARDRDSEKKP
jgi:hypothetical protein